MRQVTRKGLMTVAAATGVIAAASGAAHADAGATGAASHSPGVLSGNSVQVPVHVPVNVCGNTVDVVGVLNPVVGNACANDDKDSSAHQGGHGRGHGGTDGGSHAGGHSEGSPGVGSGNHVQVPVDVPVNVCGNSVDVIGIGNAALGDRCANDGGSGGRTTPPGDHGNPPDRPGHPGNPGTPETPDNPGTPTTPDNPGTDTPGDSVHHPAPQTVTTPHTAQLAETGSELPLGVVLPAGAGALLAGAVLYRKARASA
ncbi:MULTISPECIES: chaplin [Streptomyces]|uniref:DUF320 domain-containing protein n=1 Tax=Streptomyces thermoviolaceus subsp. thermoviolaceus TaxID=66860 RepID=A0ABX0YKB6_STRTL|nr:MULTISPECIES: chaplin [Streptomyces]MCM3264047.1 DUF320 domain-containing protein [Streptomyces thermoviolaceus]NJP12940.1 DUF320 domain-containing protein [Streptomyces thermoviolaceus subsp. thermoviolaceus]RSR96779.1 DUF320 domain-containing protein [Streptomyces sp. WAC00469]WTD49896.1 chaplin family protein [Streptomyces thermoviolaceus]GGV67657.1 hypothetical protein GCM10010499_14140 [Streptomyces thermoviolaceus subsp. apingens]